MFARNCVPIICSNHTFRGSLYQIPYSRLFSKCQNLKTTTPGASSKFSQPNKYPGPVPPINVETWVANLNQEEQNELLSILQKYTQQVKDTSFAMPLTTAQFCHVGFHYSLPFIGFGFLDNFIMIVAGDYIDITIGTALGISTMAAAALGNAISDVAGVGSAQFVESLTHKLGLPSPNLEPRQYTARSTKWAINIGRAIGVAIGCLLGMVPLLFLPTAESKHNREKNITK